MSSHESFRGEESPKSEQSGPSPREFLARAYKQNRERPAKQIKEQWEKDLCAEVPNSITRERVESAVELFRKFCALDNDLREAIHIPGPNGRGAASFGFVERTPDRDPIEEALGKAPEHKKYFHYRPFIERDLREQIAAAGPEAQRLVENLRELWITMEQRAYETLVRLEQENALNPYYKDFVARFFPDGITKGDPNKREPKLKLRLMMYQKIEGKNVLSANNHYDAGALSFAICESAPGLQVGSREVKDAEGRVICSEHMKEVDRPDGTALFWPSFTFSAIDPEVKPTWHGVKQYTHGNIAIGEENRWVLVAFLNEYEGKLPTIEEAHGVTDDVKRVK